MDSKGRYRWGGQSSRRHKYHTSFTSESSSDSETEFVDKRSLKKAKKQMKKQMKCLNKMRGMGGMAAMAGIPHLKRYVTTCEPNHPIAKCTLCCHRIKPLAEMDVLECGHLYHRVCLKQLFELGINSEERDLFCCQCKQKIADNLVNELKVRFGCQTMPDNSMESDGQQMVVNLDMNG